MRAKSARLPQSLSCSCFLLSGRTGTGNELWLLRFLPVARQAALSDIEHSYIIELKYAARTATDAELAMQADEGHRQLLQYSEDKVARQLASRTTFHRLLIQFRGWDMVRCEEV